MTMVSVVAGQPAAAQRVAGLIQREQLCVIHKLLFRSECHVYVILFVCKRIHDTGKSPSQS